MPDEAVKAPPRSIFIHIVEVDIRCPLCSTEARVMFHRDTPTGGFFPALYTCPCGRYSYGHHD
jgi:hypothetical protein